VFAPYLLGHSEIHLSEVIDKLITEEQIARNELVDLFKRDGIPYIDTLPALRREVGNQLYYRSSSYLHPIKTGYAVIGSEVASLVALVDRAELEASDHLSLLESLAQPVQVIVRSKSRLKRLQQLVDVARGKSYMLALHTSRRVQNAIEQLFADHHYDAILFES